MSFVLAGPNQEGRNRAIPVRLGPGIRSGKFLTRLSRGWCALSGRRCSSLAADRLDIRLDEIRFTREAGRRDRGSGRELFFGSSYFDRVPGAVACQGTVRSIRDTGHMRMETSNPVYLDYQASTPCDFRVIEEIGAKAGNPSSGQHAFGRERAGALDVARLQVAELVGGSGGDVVFTSGATEANNLAILGFPQLGRGASNRILVGRTEHPSVLAAAEISVSLGWEPVLIDSTSDGLLDLDHLEGELKKGAGLVSAIAANNEVGALNPVARIGAMAHEAGAVFHTDATQALSDVRIDLASDVIDLVSISGHKICGPQGIGALLVRNGLRDRMMPQLVGGGQEGGLRSGTQNVAGAVGLGLACELLLHEGPKERLRVAGLRDRLATKIRERIPDARFNGPSFGSRLAGNLNVTFFDADADAVMANAPGVAMATGSACSSSAPGPSHVLKAMGMSSDEAECSIRLSLGRFTTADEIDRASRDIADAVAHVRSFNSEAAPRLDALSQ